MPGVMKGHDYKVSNLGAPHDPIKGALAGFFRERDPKEMLQP